jgi:uncharacterized protein YgiM (DUF1202 family)
MASFAQPQEFGGERHVGRSAGKRSHGALLLLLLIFEVCAVALPALARVPPQIAQAITETRLRADPSMRGEPLLRLPAGAMLTVHGKPDNGWYQARRGPLEGYVRSGDVATAPLLSTGDDTRSGETIDEPRVVEERQRARGRNSRGKEERKQDRKRQRKDDRRRHGSAAQHDPNGVITSTDLNLRESADQNAPVRAVVPRGERVEPTGELSDGWVELRWDGESGWVLGRFLAAPRPIVVKRDDNDAAWGREELKAIIFDAADRYGQPREDMLRVARCESNMVPSAVNEHGGSYGLFQFKPGTWLSTPYGEYDIFDPRPNANAAAWMWSVGRRREWVCQ